MEQVMGFKDFIRELTGKNRFFFFQESISRVWSAECQGDNEVSWTFGKVDHREIFALADMCLERGFDTLLVRR